MSYDVQKAGMWKRISAYLFDFILLSILTVGVATLLSLVLNYDSHFTAMNDCYAKYEAEFGISFDTTSADFDTFTDAEKENYTNAVTALYDDDLFIYSHYMMVNLSFIIIIFSVLIAYLALEFAVPMFLKNGQTLGKKVFGIAVMRFDGVKIDGPLLFTRTILGKYAVETMLPILFLLMIVFNIANGFFALIAIAVVVITNIVMIIVSKNNCPIHDMLASTVTVDFASQLIFDSPEALLEYKQKIHAEAADNAQYF